MRIVMGAARRDRRGAGRCRRRVRQALLAVLLGGAGAAGAGPAVVEHARFDPLGPHTWRVSVTLRHADTGWEHYADAWRVVLADGTVLGVRTLFHPHVEEQPFTRALSPVRVPPGVHRVAVEAHDKVHGWNAERLWVDLDARSGPGFEVGR